MVINKNNYKYIYILSKYLYKLLDYIFENYNSAEGSNELF